MNQGVLPPQIVKNHLEGKMLQKEEETETHTHTNTLEAATIPDTVRKKVLTSVFQCWQLSTK